MQDPVKMASAPTQSAPFLFRFALKRSRASDIPGGYCPSRHLWMVGNGTESKPLVESTEVDLLEITTKTMADAERDDNVARDGDLRLEAARAALLEITTKTEAEVESEDRVVRN